MKIDRLISILVVLLRKERVQAKELAEMFGVSVRTILRDVDTINLAGIPIVTYQGFNGGIGIAEGYRLDKSILTSDDMAAILAALKGMDGTIQDARYEVLTEKLKNTLSSAQMETLDLKTNQLMIDLSPWGGNGRPKEIITQLRQAIEQFREIEFVYTDAEGRSTSRRGEPYTLVLKGQNWYVYVWCLMRRGFRLFKVTRMKDLVVLDRFFEPRPEARSRQPLEQMWQTDETIVELELIFDAGMEQMAEEWFSGEWFKREDGRFQVNIAWPENKWLYGFLLSFGPGLEVAGPPHIRALIAQAAGEILNKYKQ